MADWTPQQLQQMNAVVMGTHDRLTPGGQIQPGYTLDQIYGGILPAASASRPAMASNQPTPAQLAAMKAIPAGSYQTPPNRPILSPNTPAGSQFQDTGNKGRASGSMLEQLMLAGQPQPLNITVRGGQQPIGSKMGNQMFGPPMPPNVPLPRSRPGYAPTAIDMAAINRPVGANPGMGGAMFGNGVMAPGIAPQGPPPAGIAPTIWAGAATPPPTTLTGSSTGKQYVLGSTGVANGFIYGATPQGFVQLGRVPGYVAPVNNYGADGFTSSGQSRTLPSGESWAAGSSSSGGGPASGGEYGGGR